MYQKSLFLLGHPPEGLGFQDEDLRTSFLPGLNVTAARSLDQVPSFTPVLNYLSDGELETVQQKDKKPKALFKAPPVPPSVLRPRAHVHAPTPSMDNIRISSMAFGTVRIAVARRTLLLEDGRDLLETNLSVVSVAGHYPLVLRRYSRFV